MSRREHPRRHRVSSGRSANVFAQIQSDIRALNSSVLLLSQKMQYLVRNEKVLGRNLIVLSKRLKELEATGRVGKSAEELSTNLSNQLAEFSSNLENHGYKILELQNEIADLKDRYITRESFSELKYVIDAINPLEFVTQQQLAETLKKIGKKRK